MSVGVIFREETSIFIPQLALFYHKKLIELNRISIFNVSVNRPYVLIIYLEK